MSENHYQNQPHQNNSNNNNSYGSSNIEQVHEMPHEDNELEMEKQENEEMMMENKGLQE